MTSDVTDWPEKNDMDFLFWQQLVSTICIILLNIYQIQMLPDNYFQIHFLCRTQQNH